MGWPEWLLLALIGALTGALLVRAPWWPVTFAALVVSFGYGTLLHRTTAGSRLRLFGNFCLAWMIYAGSTAVIEALRLPLHHHALLTVERSWFGETPSVVSSAWLPVGLAEVLSAAYLSYQIHLHWAFIDALFRDDLWRRRLSQSTFPAFAIGLAGFFLLPASVPSVAFPELFSRPITGGWLTHFDDLLNHHAAARYDAFPSLHVLITLCLLTFDWRYFRLRFWIMLAPALLMLPATIALRLHYAVDLLASFVLFALLLVIGRMVEARTT